MRSTGSRPTRPLVFGVGLVIGGVIAFVDNFAFGGEVSPIVIVIMLIVATGTATGIWCRRGWVAAAATWACVPLAHAVKHVLGLPDTVQPNTYKSILLLAAFTLVVAGLGVGIGLLLHGGGDEKPTGNPRPT